MGASRLLEKFFDRLPDQEKAVLPKLRLRIIKKIESFGFPEDFIKQSASEGSLNHVHALLCALAK
jgi:hypothetical protein